MQNNENIYVAIMAGGIGSRFWPFSRVAKPKQFLNVLNTGESLIQLSYDRFKHVCPKENIYIVTSIDYVDLVKEQIPDIHDDQILAEPIRRNTAPCIAYVSQKIYTLNKNARIIVTPADHLILKEKNYYNTLEKALAFIDKNDVLLTLGIEPTRPDTGYGYIQYEETDNNNGAYKVKAFTEKPDKELANTFVKSGDFLWNSGTFIWRASTIMKAFKKYLPEIFDAITACNKQFFTAEEPLAITSAYTQCTSISIDYGIMEKAENVYVIPANFGWSDIGTWTSLYEVYEKDYLNNAVKGKMVHIYDSVDNMIVADDKKLVVVNGLTDYCVIDSDDILLIFKKDREQEVKKITSDLKSKKLDRYL